MIIILRRTFYEFWPNLIVFCSRSCLIFASIPFSHLLLCVVAAARTSNLLGSCSVSGGRIDLA